VLTFAAARPEGRTSAVSTDLVPVDVPAVASTEAGGAFAWTTRLRLRGGPQILSLAITDELSGTTSYVQPQVVIGGTHEAN
jgi:hypothetical protein